MNIAKTFKHLYLRYYVNLYLPTQGIRVIEAKTDEQLKKLFAVRWKVYVESGYIDPKEYPQKIFRDEYDPYSVGFLAMDNEIRLEQLDWS